MSLEDTEPAVRGCDAQPGWQRGGCASSSGRGLVYETLPAIAIFLIVFRHAVLLNKKAPVVYHSKSHKKRRWWVMCEVRGTRCEPSLCSFARCFVTRRRGSWAIVMGITKKIGSSSPPRAAAAVWSLGSHCPSSHLAPRMPALRKTAGVSGQYLALFSIARHLTGFVLVVPAYFI